MYLAGIEDTTDAVEGARETDDTRAEAQNVMEV